MANATRDSIVSDMRIAWKLMYGSTNFGGADRFIAGAVEWLAECGKVTIQDSDGNFVVDVDDRKDDLPGISSLGVSLENALCGAVLGIDDSLCAVPARTTARAGAEAGT